MSPLNCRLAVRKEQSVGFNFVSSRKAALKITSGIPLSVKGPKSPCVGSTVDTCTITVMSCSVIKQVFPPIWHALNQELHHLATARVGFPNHPIFLFTTYLYGGELDVIFKFKSLYQKSPLSVWYWLACGDFFQRIFHSCKSDHACRYRSISCLFCDSL